MQEVKILFCFILLMKHYYCLSCLRIVFIEKMLKNATTYVNNVSNKQKINFQTQWRMEMNRCKMEYDVMNLEIEFSFLRSINFFDDGTFHYCDV